MGSRRFSTENLLYRKAKSWRRRTGQCEHTALRRARDLAKRDEAKLKGELGLQQQHCFLESFRKRVDLFECVIEAEG